MRRTWRTLIRSSRAASAWVRSPLRTLCMTLRTSRSFWLIGIRSGVGTSIAMAPPWPEQGGHFYRVKTGHFYCRSTGSGSLFCAVARSGGRLRQLSQSLHGSAQLEPAEQFEEWQEQLQEPPKPARLKLGDVVQAR